KINLGSFYVVRKESITGVGDISIVRVVKDVVKGALDPLWAGGVGRVIMAVDDELVIIVGRVKEPGDSQLLLIVNAPDAFACGFGPGQSWEQHGGQDGNDCDND